jgi:hypothetical protein
MEGIDPVTAARIRATWIRLAGLVTLVWLAIATAVVALSLSAGLPAGLGLRVEPPPYPTPGLP